MIRSTRLVGAASLVALLVGLPASVHADDGAPRVFETPEAAAHALVEATEAHDVGALVALVGEPYAHIFRTGDDAADREARKEFTDAAGERVRLAAGEDGRVTIHVGYADWALPVPLVRRGGGWVFDGAAGAEEVANRRVGANEIAAITFCEAVYMAQSLYHGEDHDGDGVLEYAARLVSSPGRHDGLYWDAGPNEPVSPLGRVLGVSGPSALGTGPGALWMGYAFRLLTSQGPCAPGGTYGYGIRGNLLAGFAVVATPQRYGITGVATFLMGPDSVVLQRDYGRSTATCACRIRSFSPDAGWTRVDP